MLAKPKSSPDSEAAYRGQDKEIGAQNGRVVVSSLHGRASGQPLLRPLRGGPSKSFVNTGTWDDADQRQQKHRNTFLASTIAVLMLVVVLPSWGRALVTMMTSARAENWRAAVCSESASAR